MFSCSALSEVSLHVGYIWIFIFKNISRSVEKIMTDNVYLVKISICQGDEHASVQQSDIVFYVYKIRGFCHPAVDDSQSRFLASASL